jgi:uncharacterized protein (TIGR03067 family)
MKTKLALLFPVGFALVAGATAGDAARKDRDQLQGTWEVVAAERDGKPLDRIKGGKLAISGQNFTIQTASGAELKGDYRLDPGKKPKAMDLTHTEGALRDKTWQAIYQLDGEELKICYAETGSGKDRPTEFTTAEGSGRLLTVLKRVKR